MTKGVLDQKHRENKSIERWKTYYWGNQSAMSECQCARQGGGESDGGEEAEQENKNSSES